jgi:hypothetical protein
VNGKEELLTLLSQLRPRIRPLNSTQYTHFYIFYQLHGAHCLLYSLLAAFDKHLLFEIFVTEKNLEPGGP